MKTIFKYKLEITEKQVLPIPKRGEFLDFQNQDSEIVFWMEVDTEDMLMSDEEFFIIVTGQPIPDDAQHYHASVQIGMFVWHIYQSIF